MLYLRIFLCLSGALPLWHRALTAQAKPNSSSDTIPSLGGRWLLTSGTALPGTGPYFVTVLQTGAHLRADVPVDGQCAGTRVKMLYTLEGGVDANSVWFRRSGVRIVSGSMDSRLASSCVSAYANSPDGEFSGSTDFHGTLSADGKKIVGPYDFTADRRHVWTFER